MAGRIAIWLATLGGALGNVQAGKMRALAVSGPTRAAALPDVPTFKEQGLAMEEETTWFGFFFAPKGTPKDVIAKVNGDVERILAQDDVKARGVTLGFRYIWAPRPDKLAAFLKNETAKWAEVAKESRLGRALTGVQSQFVGAMTGLLDARFRAAEKQQGMPRCWVLCLGSVRLPPLPSTMPVCAAGF